MAVGEIAARIEIQCDGDGAAGRKISVGRSTKELGGRGRGARQLNGGHSTRTHAIRAIENGAGLSRGLSFNGDRIRAAVGYRIRHCEARGARLNADGIGPVREDKPRSYEPRDSASYSVGRS